MNFFQWFVTIVWLLIAYVAISILIFKKAKISPINIWITLVSSFTIISLVIIKIALK
jgi:hypothetical protein